MQLYSNTIKHHVFFFYSLIFLHFNNMNQPDNNDNNCNRLWKMRTLSDQLKDAYAKFYNTSEHLVVDEIIVLLKGRVIFK